MKQYERQKKSLCSAASRRPSRSAWVERRRDGGGDRPGDKGCGKQGGSPEIPVLSLPRSRIIVPKRSSDAAKKVNLNSDDCEPARKVRNTQENQHLVTDVKKNHHQKNPLQESSGGKVNSKACDKSDKVTARRRSRPTTPMKEKSHFVVLEVIKQNLEENDRIRKKLQQLSQEKY